MRKLYFFGKTIISLLLICVSIFTVAQQPRYSNEIEDKIKKVENNLSGWVQLEGSNENSWNLQQRMQYYKIKGLSIAVIRNFKIEWVRGYGLADTATMKPVTVETLFQAGSISKSLNGVGVLKLVQEKKIDLYSDINNYLQSWKFPYDSVSKGKKITIANLLSHTAGLTIHGFPGYKRGDTIPTLQQILDGKPPANTKAVRSVFEPGLRYQYAGGGTTILQVIVQDVTHQPYDVYMLNNVLTPLQMTMSSYTQPPAADKQKFLATGYLNNGIEVEKKYHVYPEQAAAGLWTNPTDLSKYIIETQLSLQGKSSKVLSQQMTKVRLTPYVDSSAALGVFITKKATERYFGHNGADEGFLSAYTGSFDGGNGVVVMVNSDNGKILNEVINSVANIYGWEDYYKPVAKRTVALPDSLLNSYVGDYVIDTDTIHIRKGQLLFIMVNNNKDTNYIYFTSSRDFFTREFELEFTFEKDASEKITGFKFKEGDEIVRAKRL
ncbi:MAG: serine hydrolase domain-containing protein [Ginsengibacter sp.]